MLRSREFFAISGNVLGDRSGTTHVYIKGHYTRLCFRWSDVHIIIIHSHIDQYRRNSLIILDACIGSIYLDKQYLIRRASLRCKMQCLVAGISKRPAIVFFPQYSKTSGASVTTAPSDFTFSNLAGSTC
jgi:hypothetical protein